MWTEEISAVRISLRPSVDLKTTKMLWDAAHRPRGLQCSWFANLGQGCGGARLHVSVAFNDNAALLNGSLRPRAGSRSLALMPRFLPSAEIVYTCLDN